MAKNTRRFFDPALVSQVLCINHPTLAAGRWNTFTKMAKDLGIHVKRIPATYSIDIPENGHDEIIARTKATDIEARKKGFGSLETNKLFDPQTASEDTRKNALAKYSVQLSYISAIEEALKEQADDDDRWIIIFEDDASLKKEARKRINEVLRDAPSDAGALMLTGIHRLWSGCVPLKTADDRLLLPSQCNTTTAIAYCPEMLGIMLHVYKKNIQLSKEDGGVNLLDFVNAVIQERQALGNYPARKEYKIVVDTFEKVSKGKTATRFYALNPFAASATGQKSTISSFKTIRPDLFKTNKPLPGFSYEEARKIRDLMKYLSNFPEAMQASHIIMDNVADEGTMNPREAISQLTLLRHTLETTAPAGTSFSLTDNQRRLRPDGKESHQKS